jgi:hypothetical protein
MDASPRESARGRLPWPEKIKMAEQVRDAILLLRAGSEAPEQRSRSPNRARSNVVERVHCHEWVIAVIGDCDCTRHQAPGTRLGSGIRDYPKRRTSNASNT